MKIISLNVWGGRIYDKLESFIKTQAPSTDVFCFQEFFDGLNDPRPEQLDARKKYSQRTEDFIYDLNDRVKSILPGFNGSVTQPYSNFGERLAMYVKTKTTSPGPVYETLILKPSTQTWGGVAMKVGVRVQYLHSKSSWIIHTHGFWTQGNKNDTPERLQQSKNLLKLLGTLPGEKVLLGDFNLNPETKSIAILTEKMRNLIKEYDIKTTRSPLSAPSKGTFADYAFLSQGVKLNNFQVLNDEVSDHLPLNVEIE